MPSENVGAVGTSQLPPKLQADHQDFVRVLSGWVEGGAGDVRTLSLLTHFGLLVYDHALRFSLISKGDRSSLFTRHILDSLNPVSLFARAPSTAVDVGSGAGFPGIPLAVVWPSTSVTLIERREKKAAFLERVARELGLKNVKVIASRLEDLGPKASTKGQESVFIRALGSLPELLAAAGPMSADGGRWVYFLGADSSADRMRNALGPMGVGAEVGRGQFGGNLLHGRFAGGGGPRSEGAVPG